MWIRLQVRARGGFSLLDLKRFAQARGYQAEGFTGMSIEELATQKSSVIVPIRLKGFDHFIVVRGFADGRVNVADPGFGNLTMKVDRFQALWKEGIVFVVHPPSDLMMTDEEAGFGLEDSYLTKPSFSEVSDTAIPAQPALLARRTVGLMMGASLQRGKAGSMWFQMLNRHGAATSVCMALVGVASVADGRAAGMKTRSSGPNTTRTQPPHRQVPPRSLPSRRCRTPMTVAINQRLQDALRERDAIIRNLLERVQELEWRVNGGFTTTPKDMIAGGDKPQRARIGRTRGSDLVGDLRGHELRLRCRGTAGKPGSRSGADRARRSAAAAGNDRDR